MYPITAVALWNLLRLDSVALMQKPLPGCLFFLAILVLLAMAAIAQDLPVDTTNNSRDTASSKISKDILASHGFRFDDKKQPMCRINGPEGPCDVEAFVAGETDKDKNGHTCAKLDRSTYLGHCSGGKLDGFSIVIADGSAKGTKEAFVSYFLEGHIAYPTLTSFLAADMNFGVDDLNCKIGKLEAPRCGYGCVYFGKWDHSAERCGRFSQIYGADIFTDSNAQKLRDGTFDLSHYRAKFFDFLQRQ